ncbi:ParB/RepB/Spo0J family partition protein [Pseudoruegeria sp. SK021]|uniref:ParB/RepB/Spo0J family partition protein n=1 Tax=Pseudoruegeria sp. SK021 TaxID=1933035 RepID=UPI000A215AF5|nr:ParB/RepB/Spo0J family partition protein [Pseudoruegeria sp. SK021]OSP54594.1 chromosome partitioning protein ParB [Pseudoruegeria sp. SK021]
MSKKHDAVFDDILGDFSTPGPAKGPETTRSGTRFLKRSTTIGDRLSGDLEEKTLRWVDPADCRMWVGHNRAYDLLTEDNCRDLIDGIRSQGRQEFAAIVRHVPGADGTTFEVICGARRHFAVSWLRANNYPQFKYLIDVRDLTDEEAFRLADIENRDREDISDYERAIDYAAAIEAYYGGKQKTMAARLEVSETWLSRYLVLARLPEEVVAAYRSIRDIKELHARHLKPLLADPDARARIVEAAETLAEVQRAYRTGDSAGKDGAQVITALRAAGQGPKPGKSEGQLYRRAAGESGLTIRRKGPNIQMEFREGMSEAALKIAFDQFVSAYLAAGRKLPTGKS